MSSFTEISYKLIEDTNGYFKFDCTEIDDFRQKHFLPVIVHFLLPHIHNAGFSRLLFVSNPFKENFRILLYHSNGIFEELYTEQEDNGPLDMMYNAYPIQFEICPFLIANFQTKFDLSRDFKFTNNDMSATYKIIRDRILKQVELEKSINTILKAKMSFIVNSRFDLNKFAAKVASTSRPEKDMVDLFICDFDFKIDYNTICRFRIYFDRKESKNESISLFILEKDKISYIDSLTEVYEDKNSFWKTNKANKIIEKFEFPMMSKRHISLDSDSEFEDDRVAEWDKPHESEDC